MAVFPGVKKGGLLVGGEWGRGIISAKSMKSGTWSAPAFLTLTGGSIGAQIGGQEVDLLLVVIDQKGLEQLASNQFKLGADAGVSAGPVGRNSEASTDVQMRAQDPQLLAVPRPVCRRDPERRKPEAGSRRQRALLRPGLSHVADHHRPPRQARRDPVPAWRDLLTSAAK